MLVSEENFYTIVQDTICSTLGFTVDPAEVAELSWEEAVTVCVKLTGAWEGEVRLHCSQPLAQLIAAAMFERAPDPSDRAATLDALSEITHIIGGNLKAILPQPVALSLPSQPNTINWAQTTPQWQLICRLSLVSQSYPLEVTLLGNQPLPSRTEAASE